MSDENIKQLQLYEHNLQGILMQKQQFQTQQIEVESALRELGSTEESFKIIGNIMVKTEPKELKKELEERKKMIDLRIKAYEKQESEIKEKSKKLQAVVMK